MFLSKYPTYNLFLLIINRKYIPNTYVLTYCIYFKNFFCFFKATIMT